MGRDRSFYIDDLNPPKGTKLKCKASIADSNFTPGMTYEYLGHFKVKDDNGDIVIPAARFQPISN